MSFYTVLLVILARLRWATGGASAIYPVLLWLVPLGTSFMFFMFLRDVYQHSNADAGRLTNSRVFFTDPFTRWAVFVYGQDMHIPHHLFPAVPHYRLRRLHEFLKQGHTSYRDAVVETHGTFHDTMGRPTILDEMTRPRSESSTTTVTPATTKQTHGHRRGVMERTRMMKRRFWTSSSSSRFRLFPPLQGGQGGGPGGTNASFAASGRLDRRDYGVRGSWLCPVHPP